MSDEVIERPGRDDEARCVGAPLLVWVRGRTEMGRVEPRQFEPGRWWVEVPRDGLNTDVDTADEAIRLGREAIARAYEPEPSPAPVPHFAIVPGFWRVEGYDGLTEATRGGHVRVKAHTGEGLVVWGLSFWGETATWAYRTYGMALDEFLARYPASLWFPEVDATPATEAPTAPSEPDEGAASPAGPGEAVRPRVGAWDEGDRWATQVRRLRTTGALRASAWPNGAWATEGCGHGTAPTLDAAKAAADAALEAAGYVLEGGAHVDPGADTPSEVAHAAAAEAQEADRLRAEVARLTAERDEAIANAGWLTVDVPDGVASYTAAGVGLLHRQHADAVAMLDRIAEALGVPDDWRDLADDVLEVTAADWREQAKRHEDAATVARGEVAVLREALARLTGQAESAEDVARVLRCEPGDVAGAALAALEQAALARGEAAGLERALRVLAEVRRG